MERSREEEPATANGQPVDGASAETAFQKLIALLYDGIKLRFNQPK